MKIIEPNVKIKLFDPLDLQKSLERYARVCYKSEDRITSDSYRFMLTNLIKRGHESVLEHEKISTLWTIDRGVSHELVRHRVGAAYSQESTRYCNYSGEKFGSEITVIKPFFFEEITKPSLMISKYELWENICQLSENGYFNLLKEGATPQEARSVLPNSLKTEIVVTYNLREWRHFFNLRADATAHPQMQQVAIPLLLKFKEQMPVLFNDVPYNTNFDAEHYAEIGWMLEESEV